MKTTSFSLLTILVLHFFFGLFFYKTINCLKIQGKAKISYSEENFYLHYTKNVI